MMEQKRLKEFRGLIGEKIQTLMDRTERTVGQMNAQEVKFPDPSDRGTMESERNLTLRIRDRERKLIIKLKRAMERIDKGTFGECSRCGEIIGKERLIARPEAELCIDCKEEAELREKRVKEIGSQILK